MNKRILPLLLVGVAVLAVVIGGVWVYSKSKQQTSVITSFEDCVKAGYPVMESYPRQCRTPEGRSFVETVSPPNNNPTTTPPNTTSTPPNGDNDQEDLSNLIQVASPTPNATIKSPLTVRGQARGPWYFEASFPVTVVDANGKRLGIAPIQAKGEWMTQNFVPFEGTVQFSNPETDTGFVVFQNDNPSGLPENSKQYRIPVKFDRSQTGQTTVKVYFHNQGRLTAGQDECTTIFPVERKIAATSTVARAALEELLKGPSEQERSAGYRTSLNMGAGMIQSLTIQNGVARVDFSENFGQNVAGSCRVIAIRQQVTETLKQFPTVTSVVISINGRTEDVLQP